ncbi:DUF262 domain-containing protein [Acinetobacter ursingii]|uniref:DUF262 domain-containing protein n=1 Tax=Acinetobacter ursingii TaxID=108980 RepID=A0AA46S9G1_9GAMM|nr:DUF262 domain-containing protein [Acinetobacter ursingii]MDH2019436.1 DUF262 domain-containing protein [Acinetobacter ursingii]MDH2071826.1 DUF262 domain-containing protein [Acinetobacter ursingii]UYF76528.1 DUF262 domain-containing protein [Acinetobacter ursingii]
MNENKSKNSEELLNRIQIAREEIKPDNGRVTIGEIITSYNDEEIILNPNFQRVFRWSPVQKSRLIESILLGIPLPPIFVSVDKRSIWTIIDGVQRLSTLLEFSRNLIVSSSQNTSITAPILDLDNEEESEDDEEISLAIESKKSFPLVGLKKLNFLNGLSWDDLDSTIQRIIKKSYLDIISISTVKHENTKYELFQRLNTGGSHLSAQEIRNCLIIIVNESYYTKLREFSNSKLFKDILYLSQDKINTDYHVELLLRYLIAKNNNINYDDYIFSYTLLKDFIDDQTINLIQDKNFQLDKELELLEYTLKLLMKVFGSNSFKKNQRGFFSHSAYEAILVGLAENIESYNERNLKEKINKIYNDRTFIEASKHGRKALDRYQRLNNFSREYFNES